MGPMVTVSFDLRRDAPGLVLDALRRAPRDTEVSYPHAGREVVCCKAGPPSSRRQDRSKTWRKGARQRPCTPEEVGRALMHPGVHRIELRVPRVWILMSWM